MLLLSSRKRPPKGGLHVFKNLDDLVPERRDGRWVSCGSENEASPAAEPKIGLVLGGRSRLGLAHIGVIRWLEEHRIPVSYVAGTSMGGLVGGLYATGNSPAELQKLVDGIDWDVVLRGEVPYRDLSVPAQGGCGRRYPTAWSLESKAEFGFPEGFNSGHQVGLILDQIAVPYSAVSSFDELPIPFACVGTEMVHDQAHPFSRWITFLALRSTMSLPGVFTPVRTGGMSMLTAACSTTCPSMWPSKWAPSHHCGSPGDQTAGSQ